MGGVQVIGRVAAVSGLAVVLAGCDLGEAPTRITLDLVPSAVAPGDVDGDGDVDLVVVCGCATTTVLVNDGSAAFTAAPQPAGIPATGDAVLLDLDTDGDLDLASTSQQPFPPDPTFSPQLSVQMGDGAGGFGTAVEIAGAHELPRPDVTGDGVADVVFGGTDITIRAGDGDGGFLPAGTPFPVGLDMPVGDTTGDVDGDDDVLVTGVDTSDPSAPVLGAVVALNDGSGAFGSPTFSPFDPGGGSIPFDPGLVDLDGDGAADLMSRVATVDVGGPSLERWVAIALGDGAGGFDIAPGLLAREHPGPISAADVDGDGLVDVVYRGGATQDAIVDLADRPARYATRPEKVVPADGFGAPAVVDLDGDGRVDLVTLGRDGVSVFRNRL